jgi:hypothetical protein
MAPPQETQLLTQRCAFASLPLSPVNHSQLSRVLWLISADMDFVWSAYKHEVPRGGSPISARANTPSKPLAPTMGSPYQSAPPACSPCGCISRRCLPPPPPPPPQALSLRATPEPALSSRPWALTEPLWTAGCRAFTRPPGLCPTRRHPLSPVQGRTVAASWAAAVRGCTAHSSLVVIPAFARSAPHLQPPATLRST